MAMETSSIFRSAIIWLKVFPSMTGSPNHSIVSPITMHQLAGTKIKIIMEIMNTTMNTKLNTTRKTITTNTGKMEMSCSKWGGLREMSES